MSKDKEIIVTNPATGEEIGRVPVCSVDEVRDAVARAAAAQHKWAEVPIRKRCALIRQLRDAIAEHAEEILSLIVSESGKPNEEALIHELGTIVVAMSWYSAKAPKILEPRKLCSSAFWFQRGSIVFYPPRGVVAVISPSNSPLCIPLGEVTAALVAGNAALLKPSEWTPLTAVKIKEIYDDVGLPTDLFQVLSGYGSTGQALLEAGVQKVSFTGSIAVGKKIAVSCSERLIPCTLELGGKAPAIVLEDAELERTARALVWGAFANSGQLCISIERVYAHEMVYDRLIERLVDLTKRLRQGDPSSSEVDVGAMSLQTQIDIVHRLVQDAVARGARVLTGGVLPSGRGCFYPPTVIADAKQDMPVMCEEIFGPVLPVMKVKDFEEAVRLANDSHLGLNAYVFGRDTRRTRAVAARIHAGSVVMNDVLSNYSMPEVPFGGLKQSGLGWVHGEEGLRGMCETRLINYERVRVPWRELWWYPYSRKLVTVGLRLFPRTGRVLDLLARL